MSTKMVAIYDNGKLVLPNALSLPDKTPVAITIEGEIKVQDDTRAAWLKLSEETLMKTWDSPEDDIFNELLKK